MALGLKCRGELTDDITVSFMETCYPNLKSELIITHAKGSTKLSIEEPPDERYYRCVDLAVNGSGIKYFESACENGQWHILELRHDSLLSVDWLPIEVKEWYILNLHLFLLNDEGRI